MERPRLSSAPIESRAGDILMLPVALAAFWTLAYQLVLVARWPARSIVYFFFIFAAIGLFFAARLWRKTNTTPGLGYRFHASYLLLLILAVGCAIAPLFMLRPNQDDVVYFHRALTQLSALSKPILTRQTTVDADAASFSPVHLATSHEMLMAFIGHYFRIDPLYCYQVLGHVFAAFFLPFVFYWCVRRLGLERWPAMVGAVLAVGFILIDNAGSAAFGPTAFGRMWQGKCMVWILFLPVSFSLTYRFLREGEKSDILWLTFLAIAGVGLSNTALYLIPASVGCSGLAFLGVQLTQPEGRHGFWKKLQRCLLLIIPLVYPVAILALLKLNIIPKPTDLNGFGPASMPWTESVDYVVGGPREHLRNAVMFLAVPLLIIRGRTGLFLFFYVCAIWLLCLNPLLTQRWMESITAACYFRLVYLLPLPLLYAMLAAAIPRYSKRPGGLIGDRLLPGLGVIAAVIVSIYSYRTIAIMPRNPAMAWKSPSEYQILRDNTDFARAAGKYISHSKLLAPDWTASCELPLLLPKMKVVAPRLVVHYFSNAGKPQEGALRRMAQAFVEGEKTSDPHRAAGLLASFRVTIKSGRANAVAASESESTRVLTALRTIDPRWHRILEAGNLVLMLPNSTSAINQPGQPKAPPQS